MTRKDKLALIVKCQDKITELLEDGLTYHLDKIAKYAAIITAMNSDL